MLGAFQDAKRTGNGLAHTLCKGWSRYPRLLRGALRALHDGEAAAVAHLEPHLPRRSPLMIPEASVDDAASDDEHFYGRDVECNPLKTRPNDSDSKNMHYT